MPLSEHETSILRYLGKHKTATAGNIRRDLKLGRTPARNALDGLADVGLVSADHGTWPVSYSITDMGGAVLAAANEREPQ
jgi:DNA-binding IclR family transcriptional regulator